MKISEHALNMLTAKSFKNIGNAWLIKNLSQPKDFENVVELLKQAAKEPVDEKIFLNKRKNIQERIEQFGENCDGVVAIGDKNFPFLRGSVRKVAEKPVVLFYKGDITLLQKGYNNIAVIGLLNPDEQTKLDEARFIQQLADNKNIVIVSGLAFGCDQIAHEQALKSDLKTVAILPSTLNRIIPSTNTDLARKIVENKGLLITEYWEEPVVQMAQNTRYIERDRLQALFSDLVVLSASYTPNSVDLTSSKIDSGARHAMAKAVEYGINRAVIYHEQFAQNPKYDLNRKILDEKIKPLQINPQNLTESIQKIYQLLSDDTSIPKSIDHIVQSSLF